MRGWWLALSYEAPSIFCSSTNKREDVDGYEHCIYWFIIISIHYIFICITLSDAHMVICPKICFLSDQKIMAAPLMDFKGSFFFAANATFALILPKGSDFMRRL